MTIICHFVETLTSLSYTESFCEFDDFEIDLDEFEEGIDCENRDHGASSADSKARHD
jgi:hypothetical protein